MSQRPSKPSIASAKSGDLQSSGNNNGNTDPSPAGGAAAQIKNKKTLRRARTSGVLRSTVARVVITVLLMSFSLSYLFTETLLWGYTGSWTNYRNYIPRKMQELTLEELGQYNGQDPGLPIYLGIDGDVYDVTEGAAFYGKGAGYNIFAGRDCARAFATNCLSQEDHFTYDLRGLTQDELKGLQGWKSFFKNHQKYTKIGTVIHPHIDSNAELPKPCKKAAPKPH